MISGDFSGCIVPKQEFDTIIDFISEWQFVDSVSNQFGNYLQEFLMDSMMCVIN